MKEEGDSYHFTCLMALIRSHGFTDLSAAGKDGDWWHHAWGLESDLKDARAEVRRLTERLASIVLLADSENR